jgi:hypothetical protein
MGHLTVDGPEEDAEPMLTGCFVMPVSDGQPGESFVHKSGGIAKEGCVLRHAAAAVPARERS